MTFHLPAPGNGGGELNLQTQPRKLERGEDIQLGRSKLSFHNMQISDHRHFEKVFNSLRKKLNLAEDAPVIGVEALKTNVLIWRLFMSTTVKAAIHLGRNYVENLEVYFEELQNLFDITQKLTLDHQAEILNVTPIDWTALSWARSTPSHDQVITWTKAKVRVYSDSVLRLVKMSDHSEANRRWENQVK